MPNSYNGYCYSTMNEAALAEKSRPVELTSTGAVTVKSVASTGSSGPFGANVTLTYKPFTSTIESDFVITRVYPTCTNVGYLTNYSGMELADVVTTSWLVFAVWAVVWGIKNLTRGLRNDA